VRPYEKTLPMIDCKIKKAKAAKAWHKRMDLRKGAGRWSVKTRTPTGTNTKVFHMTYIV